MADIEHTTQNQDKTHASHQVSAPLKLENSGVHATESKEHAQHHQQLPHQQKEQEQQPLLLQCNELKNEEMSKPLDTLHQCVSGEEEGKKESSLPKKETVKVDVATVTISDHQTKGKELMKCGNEQVVGPRERLKRHRREVAGHVWIPEMWGQEDFLKDWIDCNAFDASLVNQNIMLARAALMDEGRRANSGSIRVENSC